MIILPLFQSLLNIFIQSKLLYLYSCIYTIEFYTIVFILMYLYYGIYTIDSSRMCFYWLASISIILYANTGRTLSLKSLAFLLLISFSRNNASFSYFKVKIRSNFNPHHRLCEYFSTNAMHRFARPLARLIFLSSLSPNKQNQL